MKFVVSGKVWRYPGLAGWHFVYVNDKDSVKIKKSAKRMVGFSFVPVKATLGKTTWDTSLFPTKEGPYLLSIKTVVRKKEGVLEGDRVEVWVVLR